MPLLIASPNSLVNIGAYVLCAIFGYSGAFTSAFVGGNFSGIYGYAVSSYLFNNVMVYFFYIKNIMNSVLQ